jgi:hypothetical protein
VEATDTNRAECRDSDGFCPTWNHFEMPDKSPEDIELEKRAADRAAAHKEMKLATGTSSHHAAVRKHALASEAHAKALVIAQKAATRSRK